MTGPIPTPRRTRCSSAPATLGEIVQVGAHVDSNTPVYIVEFEEKYVIGCLEEEIELA